LLTGLFLVAQHRRGAGAMLPLSLFRRPSFTVANGAAGAMNLCTLGTIFVLTLFLQSIQHHSPLIAGAEVIPLFAPLAVVAPFAGRLTSRIGSRLPIAVGLIIAAIGLALLVPAQPHSAFLVVLPAFLLWGIGLGILTPAVVAAAIAAVPAGKAGLASAINNTARQAGGAIGIALAGAIAGPPAKQHAFLGGFHTVALAAAVAYVVVGGWAAALVPGQLWPRTLRPRS
jgi:DHA2 family methylenomycin A resistance protein-like MFS transporter